MELCDQLLRANIQNFGVDSCGIQVQTKPNIVSIHVTLVNNIYFKFWTAGPMECSRMFR